MIRQRLSKWSLAALLLALLVIGWFGYQQPGLLKAFADLPLC